MSQTSRDKGTFPWSVGEMDWALLQKTGTINPSLNMNLNELILGILVLMYVLNEVIIQGIKVMALGKCSKTQWLRHVGLERAPARLLFLHWFCAGTGLHGVPSEHRRSKCCLSPDSLQSGFCVLTHAACSGPWLYAKNASALCCACQGESFLALSATLDAPLCKYHCPQLHP